MSGEVRVGWPACGAGRAPWEGHWESEGGWGEQASIAATCRMRHAGSMPRAGSQGGRLLDTMLMLVKPSGDGCERSAVPTFEKARVCRPCTTLSSCVIQRQQLRAATPVSLQGR